MDHLSRALLVRYSLRRESIRNVAAVEAHFAECAQCRAAADDEGVFDDIVADRESWVTYEGDPRFAELMRLAESGPAEDAEAEKLLSQLDDASAARFVWEDLPNDRRFHTGGAVRALCRRANAMCGRDPRHALALANAADRIARGLSAERYPAKALRQWRGEAQKERANALFLRGKFREVLEALDQAESEFDQLEHASVGHVAVLYIRANVFYEQDDLTRADQLAQQSASAATHLGEEDRYIRACFLRGKIRLIAEDFQGAAEMFESVLRYGEKTASDVWIARAALALGTCEIELERPREGRRRLEVALRKFTALEFEPDVIKSRWALARAFFAEGARSEGIERVRRSAAELAELGMLTDSAIATVDLAEMLYAAGRVREIPKVLDGVVETFADAGKFTGAMTALAYLNEAAAAGKLTKRVTRDVQRFLSRAESQPQLVFVPSPPGAL